MSYNRIILMGNLTRDPALSYLPSQTPVVEIGLAVNRKYRGNDGQTKEEVCFIDCQAFGKTAENINQYFRKGSGILVEGYLKFDQWEQDGQKRNKHRVAIEKFSFVGESKGGQSAPTSNPYQPQPYTQQQNTQYQQPAASATPFDNQGGENLPF